MTHDPVKRFLGVGVDADAATLLGIPLGRGSRTDIDRALQRQLQRVYRHPAGRSTEGEKVRLLLRRAAEQLVRELQDEPPADVLAAASPERGRVVREARDSSDLLARRAAQRRRESTTAAASPAATGERRAAPARTARHHELTEFDRLVLAILIGAGGWNAESRQRLVAVASAYGIGVDGLMTVIRGLAAMGAAGESAVDLDEITAGASRIAFPGQTAAVAGATPVEADRIEVSTERLAQRLFPEVRQGSIGDTVKLAVAFGLLTILFGTLFVRAVLSGGTTDAPVPVRTPMVVTTDVERTPAPPADVVAPASAAPTLHFDRLPTFLGNAIPVVAADAADLAVSVPQELDEIARKLELTDDPAEAVFRSWSVSIDTLATSWALVDASTNDAVRRGVRAALFETAGAPAASERMLDALTPAVGRLPEPVDLWRGAWKTGMLAEIAQSTVLPPEVVEQARIVLGLALESERATAPPSFADAAHQWLVRAARDLVERTETEVAAYDFWEMWIAAVRRLDSPPRFHAALQHAIAEILASPRDPGRPGPTADVLGRLILLSDYAASPVVRDATLALFDRPNITTADLWVFTSLLSMLDSATWFESTLIMPPDGDAIRRNRQRDRIAAAWPTVRGDEGGFGEQRYVQIDQSLAHRMAELYARVHGDGGPTDETSMMTRLVAAAELNRGALLIAERDLTEAVAAFDAAALTLTEEVTAPRQAIGVANQRDGLWADRLERAGRSRTEIEAILTEMDAHGDTDLGPVDADALVELAFQQGSAYSIDVARSLLIGHFRNGPNVAIAVLDAFGTEDRFSTSLADLLSEFTGFILPSPRSEAFVFAARRALVERAAELRGAQASSIEKLAEALAQVYQARAVTLAGRPGITTDVVPHRTAQQLADAWTARAESVVVLLPVPADRGALRERRLARQSLADGPVQQMVAEALACLEFHAYVASGEQVAAREGIEAILSASFVERLAARHVLAQAIEIERAMTELWFLRMGLGIDGVLRPSATSAPARGDAPDDIEWPDHPSATDAPVLEPGRTPPTGLAPQTEDPRRPVPPGRVPAGPPSKPGRSLTRAVAAAAFAVPQEAMDDAALVAQLEALNPNDPGAYFRLAEDVADRAATRDERGLAQRLFGLAGALDPARYGRSACLALADLEPDAARRRQLWALARLLGDEPMPPFISDPSRHLEGVSASMAMRMGRVFSAYRRGRGDDALELLDAPGAMATLEAVLSDVPGGARRFIEDCRLYAGRVRPSLSSRIIDAHLRIELGLLSGDERSFALELEIGGGRPLTEVDPARLAESFDVAIDRVWYRNGRWVKRGRPRS